MADRHVRWQPRPRLTCKSLIENSFLGASQVARVLIFPLVFDRSWADRVMRGKVTLAHIRANGHTAY